MERHQGTSRRQFLLQGRWNGLPTASSPTEAAWGRHVCRQGAASCPSSHHGTACLQLSQWEISTHYHTFKGENKHSSLHQLLVSSSYSCEDRESAYEGAAWSDTCTSSVISDTTAQRAVKPQLWALLSAPVPTPALEHHPAQPREIILSAPIMLSPVFYNQVIRQKLSQFVMAMLGNYGRAINRSDAFQAPARLLAPIKSVPCTRICKVLPLFSPKSPLLHFPRRFRCFIITLFKSTDKKLFKALTDVYNSTSLSGWIETLKIFAIGCLMPSGYKSKLRKTSCLMHQAPFSLTV